MKLLNDNVDRPGDPHLDGQTAIVTGAGRGVGRAIAEELASRGAAVALVARSTDELDEVGEAIRDAGGTAAVIPADVTNEREVDGLADAVETTLGPVTLLVNNAGSWRQIGPVAESDPSLWWSDLEVSLKGTYLCTHAVLPSLLERGTGRIVNVGSYAGAASSPFMTAYACAKAAVSRFTDSLAAELESTGVRVFCISPGFVWTSMTEDVAGSVAGKRFLPQLASRDAVEPERGARLVVDIATGRLDGLSGRFIHVLDDIDDLVARSDQLVEHDLYTLRLRTKPV